MGAAVEKTGRSGRPQPDNDAGATSQALNFQRLKLNALNRNPLDTSHFAVTIPVAS